MSLLSARHSKREFRQSHLYPLVFVLIIACSGSALGQGSGRSSVGTNGDHIITGYVFFPSGRRAEGNIQVKLQSLNSGELSLIADSSGAFTFSSLAPGNYTVVVNAGDAYEIGREAVSIDGDVSSRTGVAIISTSRRYTVMINLQLKHNPANARTSVVNAGLAEVPDAARTLYEKGVELARAGDSQKALDSLKAAISLYPKFPLALNELGVTYMKLGQANKAVEPLRTASNLSPEAFMPRLNLGIALLETNQFGEAATQLREALNRNDAAATAHMYLGITLTKLRNYPDAEKELRRAVELGGEQLAQAHYYLGGIYWGRGEYVRAADELETYLRLSPNAPDAQRLRGTIRELRNKS